MDSEPNDKKIEEKIEENIVPDADEAELTLACIISNLASALDNLSEIDSALLNKKRQDELALIKRRLFDSIVGYISHLPVFE